MPYRDAGIDEFCSVCAAATGRGCRRCQRPCCDVHVSRRGDCTPCDVARRERSALRVAWSGFVAVGAAACSIIGMALIGTGVSVAIAIPGVVAIVAAAGLAGERQLPPATRPRP